MQKPKNQKKLSGGAGCKSAGPEFSADSIPLDASVPASFSDWLAQPSGIVEEEAQWFAPEESGVPSQIWNIHRNL